MNMNSNDVGASQSTRESEEAKRYLMLRVSNNLGTDDEHHGFRLERVRYLTFLCEMTLREAGVTYSPMKWRDGGSKTGPESGEFKLMVNSLLNDGYLTRVQTTITDTSGASYKITANGKEYLSETDVNARVDSIISTVLSEHGGQTADKLSTYAINHIHSPCNSGEYTRAEVTPETNYRKRVKNLALQVTVVALLFILLASASI